MHQVAQQIDPGCRVVYVDEIRSCSPMPRPDVAREAISGSSAACRSAGIRGRLRTREDLQRLVLGGLDIGTVGNTAASMHAVVVRRP